MGSSHAFLEDIFNEGYVLQTPEGIKNYEIRRIRSIHLDTGKIIVIDPYHYDITNKRENILPFNYQFPKGKHPVDIIYSDDNRIFFIRISFGINKPIRWENATKGAQNLSDLEEGKVFCVPVVLATISVFDQVILKLLPKDLDLLEMYLKKFRADSDDSKLWWVIEMVPKTLNLFWLEVQADGCYPCYVGFDENNDPCRFVIDFRCIFWSSGEIDLVESEERSELDIIIKYMLHELFKNEKKYFSYKINLSNDKIILRLKNKVAKSTFNRLTMKFLKSGGVIKKVSQWKYEWLIDIDKTLLNSDRVIEKVKKLEKKEKEERKKKEKEERRKKEKKEKEKNALLLPLEKVVIDELQTNNIELPIRKKNENKKNFKGIVLKKQKIISIVSNNSNIKEIPSSISQLENLEELILTDNKIEKIPSEIAQCKYLRQLILNNNRISSIPDNINNLQFLKTLSLAKNRLTDLSDSVYLLKKLESLDLSSNNISEISESIINLKGLKKINLNDNQKLISLPKSIKELTNTQIKIDSNPDLEFQIYLDQIEARNEVCQGIALKQLQKLKIPDNEDLEYYKGTHLTVRDSYLIKKLEDGLGISLETSQSLQSKNKSKLHHYFEDYADGIFYVEDGHIITIKINRKNKRINYIPACIGKFTKLKTLHLKYVKFHFLPNSIGELSNLTSLTIYSCKLKLLP